MSASGIIGTFLGVRSPGTAYVLLHHYMGEIDGAFRAWGIPQGGTGGVAGPSQRGPRMRGGDPHRGAGRPASRVRGRPRHRRRARVRRGDRGHRRCSPRTDAKRHVPGPRCEPGTLSPTSRPRSAASASGARRARSTWPSTGCPTSPALPGPGEHLRGAISFSPSLDYMEQAYDDAKAGRFSRRPYVDMIIPTLVDPRMAPPGKHIISCFVQYAPYHLAEGTWDEQREAFGDAVVDTIAERAPNIRDLILHRQVLTPLDIERDIGLTEGNIFQGELSLEQLFFNRPGARLGALPDARARTSGCAAPRRIRAAASWAPRVASRRSSVLAREAQGRQRRDAPRRAGTPSSSAAATTAWSVPPTWRGAACGRCILERRERSRWRAGHLGDRAAALRVPGVRPHRGPAARLDRARAGPARPRPAPGAAGRAASPRCAAMVRPITLWARRRRARRPSSSPCLAPDAAAWAGLRRRGPRAGRRALSRLLLMTPPDPCGARRRVTLLGRRCAWAGATGGLGAAAAREFTRVLPQSVADFLEDRLELDALRAMLAIRGIRYSSMGPRIGRHHRRCCSPTRRATTGARRGRRSTRAAAPGALAAALAAAARAAGVEMRTGAQVVAIRDRGDGVSRRGAGGRRGARRTHRGQRLDPRTTLLGLRRPRDAGAATWAGRWATCATGRHRQGQPGARRSCPRSRAWSGDDARPAPARSHRRGAVHGATSTGPPTPPSTAGSARSPWLEATIPSLVDPLLVDGAAAAGVRHVMSVLVQSAPHGSCAMVTGTAGATRSATWPCATLESVAPGIGGLVVARQVLTPAGPGARLRPCRRPPAARRAGPRPVVRVAADAGASRATGCRSTGSTSVVPAHIPAAVSPGCRAGMPPARCWPTGGHDAGRLDP